MSVKDDILKNKTDFVLLKLNEYIKIHTDKLKIDKKIIELQKKDPRVKSHRILISKSEVLKVKELIIEEKRKRKISTIRERFKTTIKEDLTKSSFDYTKKTEIFNLSQSMIESIKLPKQAIEIKGIVKSNSDIKQEFVKMTANTFISRISEAQKIDPNAVIKKYTTLEKNIRLSSLDIDRKNIVNTSKQSRTKTIHTKITETSPNLSHELKNILMVKPEKGVIWGIKINITTKKEVVEIMSKYSNTKIDDNKKDFIIFTDLSLTIYFNKNQIVKEIEINESFNGKTQEGLKISDSCDKAIKLYGQPAIADNKLMSWENIKIFFQANKIFSMIIYSNKINIVFDKNLLVKDFVVYTQGMLLGIIIASSTRSVIVGGNNRNYVINFMKDFSNFKIKNNSQSYIYYDDVDIKYHFDENDTLNAIDMGENFLGKTLNGLKTGDTINKALKLYGSPIAHSGNLLSWNKMKIFYENNIITMIKIQK